MLWDTFVSESWTTFYILAFTTDVFTRRYDCQKNSFQIGAGDEKIIGGGVNFALM